MKALLFLICFFCLFAGQAQNYEATLYFAPDSTMFHPKDTAALNRFLSSMDSMDLRKILVRGHADDSTTQEQNRRLSRQRALNVQDYLINKGYPDSLIKVNAYGAINAEPGGKNKRVEIELVLETETSDTFKFKQEKELTLRQFYEQMSSVKTQTLTLKENETDTLATFPSGVKVFIPAQSFKGTTGGTVTDSIVLKVKAFTNLTDILQAGLSTMSNGRVLETGGMVYIDASTTKGRSLSLDKKIQILLPTKEKKEGMRTFVAQGSSTPENPGGLDWEKLDYSPDTLVAFTKRMVDKNRDITIARNRTACYPLTEGETNVMVKEFTVDGTGDFYKGRFLKNEFRRDATLTVYKSLTPNIRQWLNRHDRTDDIRNAPNYFFIVEKVDSTIKNVTVINRHEKQKLFNTHGFSGKMFRHKYIVREEYAKDPDFAQKCLAYRNEKISSGDKDALAGIGKKNIEHYIASTNQLGWTNIDKFNNDSPQKVLAAEVKNSLKNTQRTDAKLVFPDIDAVVQGEVGNGKIRFEKIPIRRATLYSIKIKGNVPHLAYQEIAPGQKSVRDFTYEPVTLKTLKNKLAKLGESSDGL